MKTVAQLEDSVAGLLSGTDLNNVTNLNEAIERSVRELAQQVSIPEASDRHNFMLYDGVFDYPAPERIFGSAVTDLRPQGVDRNLLDYVYKQPIALFDRTKCYIPNGYQITFEYRKGTPIMRIASPKPILRVILDTMSSTTGWVASGTASGLTTDTTVYYQQPASLRYTLTGAGTGTISKTLTNSSNLSVYEGVGVIFVAFRINSDADVTNFTSMTAKIGSDSSNYSSVTATESFIGEIDGEDFLLVGFDLAFKNVDTGTPNFAAIDYISVDIAHTATMTNVRLGCYFIALPSPQTLLFQTAAIFLQADGTLSPTILTNNDELVLNDAAYLIMEYQTAINVGLQNGGDIKTGKIATYYNKLNNKDNGLFMRYSADHPSEEIRTTGNWYED